MEGFAVLAIAAVVVALIVALSGGRDARILGAIRRTPRHRIAEAPEAAMVRVEGVIEPVGETVVAPLNGATCVGYRILVEESNGDGGWKDVLDEFRGVPFAVADETGRAIVDPSHAQSVLLEDLRSTSGTWDDATPEEAAILARHAQKPTGWLFNRSLRYIQSTLVIGERIAVVGTGVREPDPTPPRAAAGYRDAPPMRLRIHGSDRVPLYITDRVSEV